MNRPPKRKKRSPDGIARGHWAKDLGFLFRDGVDSRAAFFDCFCGRAPIVQISQLADIARFFARVGLASEFGRHLACLEKLPKPPEPKQELRMLHEFSYGFTTLRSRRRYTLFISVWYFRNDGSPLDGALLVGIAPAGLEGLVEAKVKETSVAIQIAMEKDATFGVMCKTDNGPRQSN